MMAHGWVETLSFQNVNKIVFDELFRKGHAAPKMHENLKFRKEISSILRLQLWKMSLELKMPEIHKCIHVHIS